MRVPVASLFRSLLVFAALTAAAAPARAEPGDEYTISVLTMSPGDPLFFRFGHNAILVDNARSRTQAVYNWGTFSFDEPGLVSKFLKARLSYWLSVQRFDGTLEQYASENRWLQAQELNLTAPQKRRLVKMVNDNALPENRFYRYHYYRDNCSTRVRDVIDTATDGSLKAVSGAPSPMTFRGETSRLTADVTWGWFFLNLAMGDFIDQPITQWEQMFVPSRVMETLDRAKTLDAQGHEIPLVKSKRMLVTSDRAPEWTAPPKRGIPMAALGLAFGGLIGWLAQRVLKRPEGSAKTPIGRRLAFALPVMLLTLMTGFLGSLFLFFWLGTDHEVAWRNENLLQTSPLSLGMLVVAGGVLLDRTWARKALPFAAYAIAGMSLLGALLKVLPWFDQVNGQPILLLLPIWGGLASGAWLGTRPARVDAGAVKAAN